MSPIVLDVLAYELDQLEREKLQHPLVGGLILFSRNFADKEQLSALVKDIRKTVSRPFLISVDHEGGRVQRFQEGFTKIPSMASIENRFDNLSGTAKEQQQHALAFAMGFVMAYELLILDIDISFAPVLDLNGVSEVIKSRAFSADPAEVIRLSECYTQGMHAAGMKTTGKHFPGHGSVAEDSHIAMPVDTRTYAEIKESDMHVFSKMIAKQQIDAIMPAHVIYPEIDDKPAGFSRTWIHDVLRGELGFNGTVFSDDLSMEAASVGGSVCDRAELALDAGCDMVLVCNSPSEAEKTIDGLSQSTTYSQRWLSLLAPRPEQGRNTLEAKRAEYLAHQALINRLQED